MSVEGIGGLFFRSRDPEARAAWYREHLGIDAGQDVVWEQAAGPTVFAPFPESSEYFPAEQSSCSTSASRTSTRSWPGSRRPASPSSVGRSGTPDEYGRFARIHDPEGLPIELWEPPAE